MAGGRGEQNSPRGEVTLLINEAESFAEIVQKKRTKKIMIKKNRENWAKPERLEFNCQPN